MWYDKGGSIRSNGFGAGVLSSSTKRSMAAENAWLVHAERTTEDDYAFEAWERGFW